jgi:N utilization substance protein A
MGLALPAVTTEEASAVEAAAPASTLLDEIQAEGLDAALASRLAAAGFPNAKSLYTVTAEQLMQVDGMDQDLAFRLIDAVQAHFGE